uniref:Geranylgeranyl transferase type-2 subunit alpha n=2 Tax=Arion vulgaris TaxID=1028688 RepID=A0A0B7AGM6_9EUPU
MSKINNNFSNYSSWHYRSKLLPVVYPDKTQPMGVHEEALLKEYELVQNGFFTDPDDQSNWFYHRWLMGRGEQVQEGNCIVVSRLDNSAIISFTKHIQVGNHADIHFEVNGSKLDHLTWHNADRSPFFSTMWITYDLCLPKSQECSIKATLIENNSEVCSLYLHLGDTDDSKSASSLTSTGSSRFSQELSALKSETLQQELQSILELMEIETDNKWVMLTIVLLMKALDPIKYEADIMTSLDKLEALDFKRINYYKDLKSKFIIENILDVAAGSIVSSVDLKEKGLTKLYHTELLPLVTVLDLTNNQLRDIQHFNYLQSLTELKLCGNYIESCEGLQHLPKLEKLFLRNNRLSSPLNFHQLQSCPRLKYLNISENPICENENLIEGLRELLNNVEITFKSL